MKLIAIDTSGGVACAALMEDDNIIAEININYKKTHSQTLVPMLEAIRSMTDLDLASLDAVAVAAGPGSFTGLRIGSATAKGMALALHIPIVPVPSLEGLAWRYRDSHALICPIMDARRSQVYTGLYAFCDERGEGGVSSGADEGNKSSYDALGEGYASGHGGRSLKVIKDSCALPIEEIAREINRLLGGTDPSPGGADPATGGTDPSPGGTDPFKEVIFLGDGVPVFAEKLSELIKVPYSLAPAHMLLQSGAALAGRAMDMLRRGQCVPVSDFHPIYLRKPQAEREREAALRG